MHYSVAFVGTYADSTFTPRTQSVIDYGGHFYAPQTMLDPIGRRLLWGWLWEGRSDAAQWTAGWAGVMSLPCILSLSADDVVSLEPAPELKQLRSTYQRMVDLSIPSTSFMQLREVQGDCLEILAELIPDQATELGIGVRCAPDGTEQTLIRYDRLQRRLLIDRQRSSMNEDVQRDIREGPLPLATDEPLLLHIFVDRSVIEVFANHRLCMSSRIYPSRPDSLGLGLFASGGSAGSRHWMSGKWNPSGRTGPSKGGIICEPRRYLRQEQYNLVTLGLAWYTAGHERYKALAPYGQCI